MSDDEKALIPVDQREVEFYGDELTALRAEDGRVYAGLAQMCAALGLDPQAQRRRIGRHAVLARGLGVANLATPGGQQDAYVLRADLVPLWLSGVRASAVREEIRPKLERFQEEAATVLWEAFEEGRLTSSPSLSDLLESSSPAVRAYREALAIVQLARNHLLMEAQIDDHGRRLEAIEAQLGDPGRHVTPDQAAQLSQAIKAVAMALGAKSGRNEYGGVYGELYRRFGITSYKLLPAGKFGQAMAWLTEWHEQTTGEAF
jgi:hypothetical protein